MELVNSFTNTVFPNVVVVQAFGAGSIGPIDSTVIIIEDRSRRLRML